VKEEEEEEEEEEAVADEEVEGGEREEGGTDVKKPEGNDSENDGRIIASHSHADHLRVGKYKHSHKR